jgi:membrane peptidoglycan carboxypeptidase
MRVCYPGAMSALGRHEPRAAFGRRPGRRAAASRHRALLRVIAVLAFAVLAAGAAAAGVLYASLPGVGDAEQRVARLGRPGPTAATALPRRVATAVVSTEDERYWHHGAVDPIALGRVLVQSVAHPGRDAGGSTIVQQLARRLYLPGDDGPLAVLRSIGLAFKLEHRYAKAQILAMYLDSVYLGHGQWGVADASRAYFGTTPGGLSWGEASLLAGLPQAPTADDPVLHFARARARQREVLHRLVANHDLTPRQATAAYRHTPRPGTRARYPSEKRRMLAPPTTRQ